MTIHDWKKSGQFFDYKGHSIFYRDEGDGEALLLIHGFPTSSWDWWKVWDKFSKFYRVIALDMMGFGYSDKPQDYQYSIFDQADLHESLLQKLGVSACHVLAHDYGDTVLQELLARFNEKSTELVLKKICLLNGGLFPGNHKPRLIQKMLMSPIGPLVSLLSTKRKLHKTFQKIFGPNTQASASEVDDFWYLMTHNGGKRVVYKVIWYMNERVVNEKRWVGALQNTTLSLCLINGGFDPISGKHMAQKFREVVPKGEVFLLEEIGHYPQVEAPEKVTGYVLDFLERNRPAQGH